MGTDLAMSYLITLGRLERDHLHTLSIIISHIACHFLHLCYADVDKKLDCEYKSYTIMPQ